MQAAIFLDRDGTLIRDVGYLCREDQLELLPRAAEGVRLLKESGFKIVVVTNQSAVARGRLSEASLRRIHDVLFKQLEALGASVDGVYYCPHHPTEGAESYRVRCDCRKPAPGMILRAAAELALEPALSYVVGDQPSDMELALRSGARGVFIDPAPARGSPAPAGAAHVVASLWEAALWIAAAGNASKPTRR